MAIIFSTKTRIKKYQLVCVGIAVLCLVQVKPAFAGQRYVQGLQAMTQELSALSHHFINGISKFFDTKLNNDTIRDYQRLNAEANKDYHPSDTVCRFGTFIRSVAQTEASGLANKRILSMQLSGGYRNLANTVGATSPSGGMQSRLAAFRMLHCDPAENGGGLATICANVSNRNPDQFNKDIDYASTFDSKLTLDVNYLNPAVTQDEHDILALARHLYWPNPLPQIDPQRTGRSDLPTLEARRLIAMQTVAHNSFTAIVAQKTASEPGNREYSGWNHMKSLLREFGLEDTDINKTLGDYPSYYAQMDVLTKKMYQNPKFYTNLYDKPANVGRINASMEAIKLMQARDQYKASLRKEMLLAMMIEQQIAEQSQDINARLND